ncbi:Bacteriocin [Elizabethkingia occulta]|uniref:Bacteriocin n=1 Tax=Elizabethkingia miricola TaxID=172045 RepID=A0ABY3NJP9_ELIMR|nr:MULTISPECIES: hypothetical protein [Elizabethkingia]MCL1657789.1 hypothetical protein [Elizabethkingia miricola]TYO93532.1 hypothetical protein LX74_00613 [Elizabethkingia miricola]
MKKITRKNLSNILGGKDNIEFRQGYCIINGTKYPWDCNQRCLNGTIPLCPPIEE